MCFARKLWEVLRINGDLLPQGEAAPASAAASYCCQREKGTKKKDHAHCLHQCYVRIMAESLEGVKMRAAGARVGKGRSYGQPWAMTNQTMALAKGRASRLR
jgi:hypothetical protein